MLALRIPTTRFVSGSNGPANDTKSESPSRTVRSPGRPRRAGGTATGRGPVRIARLSDCKASSGTGLGTRVTGPSLNAEPSSCRVRFQKATASSTRTSRGSSSPPMTAIVGERDHATPNWACAVATVRPTTINTQASDRRQGWLTSGQCYPRAGHETSLRAPEADVTAARFRVGVDIGGTFTDIVLLDADGRIHTKKVSSSVGDYARAIVEGLREVFRETGLGGGAVDEVIHGTTVASNAILELRGARAGLITTRGFRDVLELRRLRMPRLYDLTWEKPPALVERYLRAEVTERVNARGEIVTPLDLADVERVLDRLLGEGIEALAVCLLNAYANPVHEQQIKAAVTRRAPGLPLCISTDVLPEIKEYERTSTTVINAYVMPVVQRYLATLRRGLADIGASAPLLIMQSNGGLMTADAAARMPM